MKNYGPATFGELNAADYDRLHDPGTTDDAVAFLKELASGKVLELAIGTGRIALPLARGGLDVYGIDASPDMLAKLKEKCGNEDIPTRIANMADFNLADTFDFAYLVFNTICNLTTQEQQASCFASVSRHLNPGGAFLVETTLPDLEGFTNNQRTRTRHVGFDSAALEAATHDRSTQRIDYQIIRYTAEGTRLTPLPTRYIWPSEMDLMARLAGMELEERWGFWDKRPFDKNSTMHISLYRKI